MAEQKNTQDMVAFLAELSVLTIKYRIHIGGCGCCGSPWIAKIDADETIEAGAHYRIDDEGESLRFIIRPAG